MSDSTTANRTLGFRARLEARLAPLLEQARRSCAEEMGEALSRATAPGLTEPFEVYVRRLVDALVEGRSMQQAVLDRAWLVENWSLHDHDPSDETRSAVLREVALTERSAGKTPYAPLWPINVAPGDLAQALLRTRDRDAAWLASLIENGLLSPREGEGHDRYLHEVSPLAGGGAKSEPLLRALARWPILPCVRVVATYKMVIADLRKPAIAIDAGKVHHELMTGWGRAAREGRIMLEQKPDHVELFLPGAEHKPAQLTMPLDGERLSQAFVEAIKEWRSFLGLRHWIALQSLFSIQGKREGRVLWKLEEHLDALGVSKRWREDPVNRANVVREVSLLSKMQLVVYRPDGTIRARHNVLLTTAEIDVERGGQWLLEGLELQIHPWLYSGVRDQKSGQLGKHWHPAPPELAKVDHDKFRYALLLGVMLPIRWKWAWARHGTDHLTLDAGKLFELACIHRSAHDPSRAWVALEANLEELQRIGLLGHVKWEGDLRDAGAKVHLYPAEWLLDRTLQGLHPLEKALPPALPSKGVDLIAWRKARGWTQAELARQVGVGVRTVKRDEVTKDKPIGRAMTAALKAYVSQPAATPETPLVEGFLQDGAGD